MFTEVRKNLGQIKVGSFNKISFKYTPGSISEIVKLTSPFDCAIPINAAANFEVTVNFTPKPFPQHLVGQPSYDIEKIISVWYITPENKESNFIQLTFTGKVVN